MGEMYMDSWNTNGMLFSSIGLSENRNHDKELAPNYPIALSVDRCIWCLRFVLILFSVNTFLHLSIHFIEYFCYSMVLNNDLPKFASLLWSWVASRPWKFSMKENTRWKTERCAHPQVIEHLVLASVDLYPSCKVSPQLCGNVARRQWGRRIA